jgi:hypothetical protein
MASPAEIANDMSAQAAYWVRRDKKVGRACLDAARVIRAFLSDEQVDGRTYYGLHRRLLDLEARAARSSFRFPNFTRARNALEALHREAHRP